MAFQTPEQPTALTRDQQIRRAALEAALMVDLECNEEEEHTHDEVAELLSVAAKFEGYISFGTAD